MVTKLVRNRIPELFRREGKEPITSIADPELFKTMLEAKLLEEIGEFMTSPRDVIELADVLEVVYCLALSHGVTVGELNGMRLDKLERLGNFMDRTILHGEPK